MILQSFTLSVEKDFTAFPLDMHEEGQALLCQFVASMVETVWGVNPEEEGPGDGGRNLILIIPFEPLDPAISKTTV